MKYEYYYSTKFKFTKQEFGLFDYDQEEFKVFAESYELIVVGSDTILVDLKKNGNYGLMWLLGVNTNKLLFAASAAPAKYELSDNEVRMLHESFATFKLLGVRDSVTFDLLSRKLGLGDKVYRQFDPTYLIPEGHFSLPLYLKCKLNFVKKTHKIALVNFGDGFREKRSVTEYLQKKGYYVISTLRNEWADSNIMTLSAFGWAALFRYVDITITERFHDSVFTLRNNKPVIAIDWAEDRFAADGSSKTKCLLEDYGLSNMHYTYKGNIDVLTNFIDSRLEKEFASETLKINDKIKKDYQCRLEQIKQIK